MLRVPQSTVDPARDAASLLRRMGLLLLLVGLPAGALVSRNGAVIVFVVGVALIAAASAFDGAARTLWSSFGRLAVHPALVAAAVLAGWALLSLAWTPNPRTAGIFGALGVGVLALAGLLALPDRMRAANLYLIPVGAVAVAAAALALAFAASAEPDSARSIERGLSVAVLYAWPAIAWLRSRGRDGQAVALALVVALAVAAGPSLAPAFAFAFGALAYGVAQAFEERGAGAVGLLLAALVVAAPVLLVWGVPLAGRLERFAGWAAAMEPWRETILQNPHRLLTGRGLGAWRSAGAVLGNGRLPGASILALWYELGAVGAVAVAAALASLSRSVSAGFGPLLPGLAGAVATAFGLAVSGIDGGETWWFAALAVVVLAFVAAERGQFRTRRPRAVGFGRARSA